LEQTKDKTKKHLNICDFFSGS